MKCAELAIKAGLLLEGALGWWEKLQQTHAPFELIHNHVVLGDHAARLEAHKPALGTGLRAMDKLVSDRRGEQFDFERLRNPEYPFFFVGPHPATGVRGNYLLRPGMHFVEAPSRLHYGTAWDVLAAYQAISPVIATWGYALPAPV